MKDQGGGRVALAGPVRWLLLLPLLAMWCCLGTAAWAAPAAQAEGIPITTLLKNFAPFFLKGTWLTVEISVLSMGLATALGLVLALGRVYGPRWLASCIVGYVEFMRGTPLLVQLFFIYYGLPQVPYVGIELAPLTAAILGVGLNYAAYEAEIYRSGIMAVPRQQLEAALALGLTRQQAIRLVVLP